MVMKWETKQLHKNFNKLVYFCDSLITDSGYQKKIDRKFDKGKTGSASFHPQFRTRQVHQTRNNEKKLAIQGEDSRRQKRFWESYLLK